MRRHGKSDDAVIRMSSDVVDVLLSVVDDVESLVADPALAGGHVARRLVPDAHRDDPDAEADYRAVVGPQLREERSAAAARMREGLLRAGGSTAPDGDAKPVEVVLDPEEAEAWMITVNHARLAIGTACGVTEDMALWDDSDPRAGQLAVYDLLTALLDHLVQQVG